MSKYEVGTIINQTDGKTKYEIMERSADDDASLVKVVNSVENQWIPDETLTKYISEKKGYIQVDPILKSNRLDSIDV